MELQAAVKKQAVMRSSFIKIFNTTSQLLHTESEGEIDLITVKVNQEILYGKILELSTLDERVFDLMLATGVEKEELEGEISGSDVYKTKYDTLNIVSLMEFLRKEVAQEELISIATKRFKIDSCCDSRVMVPGGSEMETSIAIVAVLGGHVAKSCKMTCVVCDAKHIPLKCPKLEIVKIETQGKSLQDNEEKALANHSFSDTLLQTLIVRIKGKTYDSSLTLVQTQLHHQDEFTDNDCVNSVLFQDVLVFSIGACGLGIGETKEQRKKEDDGIKEYVKNFTPNDGHYLPKRPVLKEQGTTKVRPVFDAFCKIPHGPSLNGNLEEEPNIIVAIPPLLLWFRLKHVGVIADIEKAFLQISFSERDRDTVALTEKTTIPRLEFLATTIATRLSSKAAGNLGIDELDFQFWSDYTTVIN
ncbi:hypothetical protein PR048_009160 [Dryococelus australis]|uniref:Uncharacterized protein n=1 Tax=Dryococelus australis TaxID=614101 RepID=A0ABQ9I011_9NEOP|nr:hypothetical protein PR048_009160 [Dryococelus australis]